MPMLIVLAMGALALAMPLTISASALLLTLHPGTGPVSLGLPAAVMTALLCLHVYYYTHFRAIARQDADLDAD